MPIWTTPFDDKQSGTFGWGKGVDKRGVGVLGGGGMPGQSFRVIKLGCALDLAASG